MTIHDDRRTPPHSFTCPKLMKRILTAIQRTKVRYIFYWESDTRMLGAIKRAPTHDVMQQANNLLPFPTKELKATVDELFPQLCGRDLGSSCTGGTLIDGQKLANAFEMVTLDGFFKLNAWVKLNTVWQNVPSRSADACIHASAMVAGMTIGQWKEFNEIPHLEDWLHNGQIDKCKRCIQSCQRQHEISKHWVISIKPPDVDRCIFDECGETRLCPAILHRMSHKWEVHASTEEFDEHAGIIGRRFAGPNDQPWERYW